MRPVWRMVEFDGREVTILVIYTLALGIVSAAVPFASQVLINQAAFTGAASPIIALSLIVFGVLLIGSFIRLFQIRVAALIAKRAFVRSSLRGAQSLLDHPSRAYEFDDREIGNRFFDVMTFQVALGVLAAEGLGVIVLSVDGIIILALYHPLFFAFSSVVLLLCIIVIGMMAKRGVERSYARSTNKYRTAYWISSTDFNVEQARISEARAQTDLADAEGRLARLDTQIARQMTLDIRSPRAGVVQSILAGENSGLLKSGVAIARIVPETEERTVELFVNGLDLPFIRLGQDVRLQFEGWPILQFSGLPQLSTGTFLGTIKVIDPSDDGRGRFRLIIKRKEGAIWPEPALLRQGVRTRGWVQMNQVPLWFEIWRRINDLPPATPPLTMGGDSADNPPTQSSPPSDEESSSSPSTTNPVPSR